MLSFVILEEIILYVNKNIYIDLYRFNFNYVYYFYELNYIIKWIKPQTQNLCYHRDNDKPAYINSKGRKEWFFNGKRHRNNDKPAIKGDETKEWWVNGNRHRDNDFPAVIRADGTKEWWFNGKKWYDSTSFIVFPRIISWSHPELNMVPLI